MKMVIGLGNPGDTYRDTRHNIGFLIIDKLAADLNLEITKEKFGGLYVKTITNNQKVIFLKPQIFINLSGKVIKQFIDYYRIEIKNILVINDDLDLPIGKYKIKSRGRSGGHKGLENIELNLKTKNYPRLKIGISNNRLIPTNLYVLGKFTKQEKLKISNVVNDSKKIILEFINTDIIKVMNKFNKHIKDD